MKFGFTGKVRFPQKDNVTIQVDRFDSVFKIK